MSTYLEEGRDGVPCFEPNDEGAITFAPPSSSPDTVRGAAQTLATMRAGGGLAAPRASLASTGMGNVEVISSSVGAHASNQSTPGGSKSKRAGRLPRAFNRSITVLCFCIHSYSMFCLLLIDIIGLCTCAVVLRMILRVVHVLPDDDCVSVSDACIWLAFAVVLV